MYDLAKLSLKNIANTQVCRIGIFPTASALPLAGGGSTPRCFSILCGRFSSTNYVIIHSAVDRSLRA